MRKLLIGVLLLFIASLGFGCSTGVSQEEYEEVWDAWMVTIDWVDELEAELATVQGELDQADSEVARLQAIYPPKKFPSGEALQTWLNSDDISTRGAISDAVAWLARALELQERAARDGYIISVELITEDDLLYTVICTAAVEDGGLWWWDPNTDAAYYWLDTRHF